jgi:hypothetical protein
MPLLLLHYWPPATSQDTPEPQAETEYAEATEKDCRAGLIAGHATATRQPLRRTATECRLRQRYVPAYAT